MRIFRKIIYILYIFAYWNIYSLTLFVTKTDLMEHISAKELSNELHTAIKAAVTAGRRIMEIYNDPDADFEVERKSDNSPLTRADKAAHEVICEMLEPLQIPILSEEGREIPFEERKEWNRLCVT